MSPRAEQPLAPSLHAGEGSPILSVIVPVYNNAATLEELAERLRLAMGTTSYELLFINDGSRDESLDVLRRLAREHPEVVVLSFSRNFGQHPAISAGFERARGAQIVLMDADLQDRPEDIPTLLAALGSDVDVVYTVKQSDASGVTSRLYHFVFSRIVGRAIPADLGTFRAFTRKVLDALLRYPERAVLYGPLMMYMGFRAKYLNVRHDPRKTGRSSYSGRMRLALAVNSLVSYTNVPHQVLIWSGLLLIVGSFLYGLAVLFQYAILGIALPAGLTVIVMLIVVLGGAIMLSLGIIGTYVFRVYQEVLGRPRYLVNETINLYESAVRGHDVV